MNKDIKILALLFVFCLFINVNLINFDSGRPESVNFATGVSGAIGDAMPFVCPVEVIGYGEDGKGYAYVITNEKAVVVAPCDLIVDRLVDSTYGRGVEFSFYSYVVTAVGFEVLSVKAGDKVICGHIVGSLLGDKLFVKASKGGKSVNPSLIKDLLQ